jgi:hypothetical protein
MARQMNGIQSNEAGYWIEPYRKRGNYVFTNKIGLCFVVGLRLCAAWVAFVDVFFSPAESRSFIDKRVDKRSGLDRCTGVSTTQLTTTIALLCFALFVNHLS